MNVEGFHPRLTAIAEILLCSSVPTQLLIATGLRLAGWTAFDEAGQLSLPFVVALSLLDTILLIVLMVGLTWARGERVSELWLGTRPISREAVIGALLIPVVFVLVVVLLNLLMAVAPWLHNVPNNPLEQMAGTASEAALLALVAILAGGVREELQRAFLLRRFEQHLGGAMVGLVVLSVAFGLGHIVQGLDAVITTGVLGAFWAALYLRRRSAVAPVVSHAGFNTVEVLRVALFGQ
jgi:membrane protease YdiL (CAAX protease family)